MEILKVCLDEISLSGLEGCTVDELWKFLNNRQPPISFKLDEYIKPLAWKQLLKCAENSNAVQLYKLPAPREPKQTLFNSTIGSSIQWTEYKHLFPYRPINDATTGARGSCVNYSHRLNVTSEMVSKKLDLAGVSESYGNSLVLVTSQELRERALVPLTQTPPCDINDVQYCLLEVVGCSRHYGTCRPYITSRYLKIDARSVYHHSKELRKHGLLVIKTELRNTPDNINRSQPTNVMYLTRFAPPTDSSSPDMLSFETHICSLLDSAPYQALPLKTLQDKLGVKKFKAAKAVLVRKGYVKSVVMGHVAEEFAINPELAKAKGVQLIKPYQECEGGEEGDEVEEEGEGEGEEEIDQVPLVTELPLTSQGYRLIDSYGPQGMTHQDFCLRKGLALDHYANRTVAKSLIKQSKVFAITSDSKNVRTVVLVSDRHLQSNAEYIRLQEEKAKSSDKSVEVAVISGERYVKEKPRIKKQKEVANMKEEAGPSGTVEGAVPLISIHDDSLLLPHQQMEEGQGDDDEKGLQNRLNKSDEMEVGSIVSEADSASVTGASILDPESNPDSKAMTYHQLRRCNIIMEYMKQHRIVQGYADLSKCLRDAEKERVVSVDKKTVFKLLQRLEQNQRLFRHDDVLEAHFEDDSVVSTQPTVFWCVPDATEGEIRAAKEKAVQHFYCTMQRRNLKKKGKVKIKKEKVRKKAKVESSSEEEEESESEDGDDDEAEVNFFSKIQCSAKFQRLRHLHYYLWILAFGRDPIEEREPGGENMEEKKASGETDTTCKKEKEEEQKLDPILPETNFPWAKAVHKLPQSLKGEGWLQFSEVHHYMPLSLWLIIINMYRGKDVGKLPGKYKKYFEDLELKNRLLHQLPRKLRKIIIHQGRDMTHICDFLKQLSDMELITLEGWDVKNKTTVSICLNRSVTILDTSTAQPRSSFFTNEARHLFQPISFSFVSLADVERFWFKLQTICRQTPIILRDHPMKRDSDLALKDSYPLLYSSKTKISKNKDAEYNAKGFGAGGLLPLTFSHLSRNWKTSGQYTRTLEDSATARREIGSWASLGVGGASYMPGEGLLHLPSVSMEIDNDDDDDEVKGHNHPVGSDGMSLEEVGGLIKKEDVRDLPPAKRAKLMAGVSIVPSSQVKRNDGGRGRERYRAKKAGIRKSKSSEASSSTNPSLSSSYRYRFSQTTAMYIVDAPDAETTMDKGMAAVPNYIPERTRWLPEEDSFLLHAYLTSVVMKELGQPLVTYSMILDAFQSEFPTSGYKTVTTLKRRLNVLIRKKVELAANMEIFVTETIHMMSTLAEDCPQPTFESILEFVRKKYHSEDGSFSLAQVVLLPRSVQELHDNYQVVGGPEPKPSCLVPAESDQDIKQALLYNLTLASIGSEQSSFDQYKAFKLFETFHEEDLEAVLNELRNRYLIKLKRTTIGIPRHQGPNSTASYTLSANFFSRLEAHFLVSHLRDMEDFKETFDAQLAPSGSGHVTSDPSISLVDGGLIRVDGEIARNGTTAAVIDTIVASKNLLDCSSEFPDPLFEPGNEGAGGESEGEGEEGDGREDSSSQTARQLVKTAMKEAELERGTNSDEEEDTTMEFGEGGASEEMGGASSQATVGTAALKYRGGSGINSLFDLGAGVLRHGPIKLTPGLSVAKRLDPVTESEEMTNKSKETTSIQSSLESCSVLTFGSTAEQSDSKQSSTLTESSGKSLSHEEYLVSVGKELGFSDSDVKFAVALYNTVSSSGQFGITRESLRTHTSLSGLEHQLSFDEHIQTLVNFELIHCVGVNEEQLVSHSNSNFWSMTPEDVTKGDTPFISYLPWSSVGSSDPNVAMVTNYCRGVLNYIMTNPGVPMDVIAEHFKAVLQPTGLQRVLNVLEMSGYIKKHSRVDCSKTCHLFDSPKKTKVSSCTYYEPIL